MSTSLLYHGFGIHDYKYVKTEYRKGAIFFHMEKATDKQYCADCGLKQIRKKGRFIREIRTIPIGKKKVFLSVHLHQLQCRACGSLKLKPLIISFPKKQWTKSLGRYVVGLLKRETVEDVARHLGMSWDTVKEIHLRELKHKYKKRKLKQLRYLGVDEISVRRGHRYLTVVVDLETGEVVWVGKGEKVLLWKDL